MQQQLQVQEMLLPQQPLVVVVLLLRPLGPTQHPEPTSAQLTHHCWSTPLLKRKRQLQVPQLQSRPSLLQRMHPTQQQQQEKEVEVEELWQPLVQGHRSLPRDLPSSGG